MVSENLPSAPADRVLVLTRLLDAPRSLVFSVWAKPEHMVRWFGPKDFSLPFCEMDFRQGGKYRVCMRGPDGTDYWLWGEYREIVEPERIVFVWDRDEIEGQPNRTIVTVTLEEQGNQTKLTLHQAIFLTTEDRESHNGGWTECLVRLADYVAGLA